MFWARGPWGPLGPDVAYGGARNYLLSGKLPTVRHAPNRAIDMHPKGIDMHPKVSIYFAPNNRILAQVAFLGKTWVFRKNMQILHVRQKSHMAYFWKKNYRIHCCVARIFEKNTFWTFWTFRLLDAQKIGFGAWGRFCMFFYVQEFIDLFTIWAISINSGRCSTKVFPMNLPVKMALALFQKQF